jgi:hypothetical protein
MNPWFKRLCIFRRGRGCYGTLCRTNTLCCNSDHCSTLCPVADLEGKMPGGLPFSSKIYHLMLVKLKIWDPKYLIFLLFQGCSLSKFLDPPLLSHTVWPLKSTMTNMREEVCTSNTNKYVPTMKKIALKITCMCVCMFLCPSFCCASSHVSHFPFLSISLSVVLLSLIFSHSVSLYAFSTTLSILFPGLSHTLSLIIGN